MQQYPYFYSHWKACHTWYSLRSALSRRSLCSGFSCIPSTIITRSRHSMGIILRQFEATGLQAFYIHHHASVFGMKQFHEPAAGADEDEDITVLHFTLHFLMYHSAQRTDTFTHICPAWTQEVAHRVVQVKHGRLEDFGSILPSISLRNRSRSGHEGHWETAVPHHAEIVLLGKTP